MRIIHKLLPILLMVIPFSCAREVNESARSIEERVIKARVQVKYLDTLHKTESGLYYMIQAKGNGKKVEKENYVYVRYSNLDFNENYAETSEEEIAKQLGTYSEATYYGPVLRIAGVDNLFKGLDEMVLAMREGDRRRILLPSWLSSYGYSGSSQRYSGPTIHDVELLRVVKDIEKFQIDSLESYRDRYYPGLDSLSYGFYKKTLKEGTGDTLKTGNNVNVWFIGRFLDHFIFDLNIADTAKKYNLYGKMGDGESYEAIAGECKENEVFGKQGSDDGFVKGFSKAIFSMRHGEEAVVFFYAELGYGVEGKGKVQPFTPLVFYLKVERTNWDEEPDDANK